MFAAWFTSLITLWAYTWVLTFWTMQQICTCRLYCVKIAGQVYCASRCHNQCVLLSASVKICQGIFSISRLFSFYWLLESAWWIENMRGNAQPPVTSSSEHVSVEIQCHFVRTKIDTQCHFFWNPTWMPWLSVEPRWPFGEWTTSITFAFEKVRRPLQWTWFLLGPRTFYKRSGQSHEDTKTQALSPSHSLKVSHTFGIFFSHVQTRTAVYVVSMQTSSFN